jgi:hypothetical protein
MLLRPVIANILLSVKAPLRWTSATKKQLEADKAALDEVLSRRQKPK